MFEIGFSELLLVGLVALLVFGPERLPGAARTAGLWIGRLKRSFNAIKSEVEREIGADEIRRQLHNENILAMERQQQQASATDTKVPPAAPLPGEAPATPSGPTEAQVNTPIAAHSRLASLPGHSSAPPLAEAASHDASIPSAGTVARTDAAPAATEPPRST